MGYRSQGSPRKSSGQKFQKSQHEKAKTKAHKHQVRSRNLQEESQIATPKEIAEKTLNRLKRLGEQKFAVTPFSAYFDDWLVNLKEVLSEFESSPALTVDEGFVSESGRQIVKAERELVETKQTEAALYSAAKELSDNNHLLVQLDANYAAKTREIGPTRNAEIQSLTLTVRSLEGELERIEAMKTSFLGFTKKAKAQKEAEARRKLESAKTELEMALQKSKVEQEKLHDEYEQKKQNTIERVQRLEKEVERIDIDSSLIIRSQTCEALIDAVNALLERQPVSSADAA